MSHKYLICMCPTPFFSANSKGDKFLLWTVYLGSKNAYVTLIRFHLQVTSYSLCCSLSPSLHLEWSCLLFLWLDFALYPTFYGWGMLHCVNIPHLLYPSICAFIISLFAFLASWYHVGPKSHGYTSLLKFWLSWPSGLNSTQSRLETQAAQAPGMR